jgi:adenine-specific DNA-methyltransferase
MLTAKRALGQYSTPLRTVDYMVRKVIEKIRHLKSPKILDPAVGDGVFVERLMASGVNPAFIHAFDIDPDAVQANAHIPNIRHQDFLTVQGGEFDAIIGNPPYKSKRESRYIKENKARLERQFGEIGIRNLYAMFVHHALSNLKEGGTLCFIVQDSFLTNVYYQDFRRFILDHCLIDEIVLAPRKLFHHTDADVRTAIITLTKCTGPENREKRSAHVMTLIDRLQEEDDYFHPPQDKVQKLEQRYFERMEKHNFFINVPVSIIDIILKTPLKLGHVVDGGTGISTGNDAKFLRKPSGIAEEDPDWVPFYKNGGTKDAWFYETPYRIHRDWETPGRQYKDFMTRNAQHYFKEGITCSSMGVEFSASYMPAGCLFGVNANFFSDDREHLFYVLALLNSTLAKYIIRAVFNRTNMVTAGYIKRIPYIEPAPELKTRIADIARTIVASKKANPQFDYRPLQCEIDALIYEIYGVDPADRRILEQFCGNLYEAV